MSLSGLRDWICDFFYPRCATPAEGLLKPFYKTICFFEKAICNNPFQASSLNEPNPTRPKCSVTDYLNYLIENTCSPRCNITLPAKAQTDQAFLQTSREDMWCELNWCDVLNHLEFWWEKLHQSWCSSSNCANPHQMQFNFGTAVTIMEKGEPPCLRYLRRWLGLQAPSLYLIAVFCLTGGLFLIVNLVMRKLKHRSPSNAEEVEPGLVQRLVNSLEVTKSGYENLQRLFEENQQDLSDKLQLHQRELEVLKGQNLEKDADVHKLQQLTMDLEEKCKEYQNQIDSLLQVDKKENERLQEEVTDLQSRLDLAHELHQQEILKLHKTIAQLQLEDQKKTSNFNKRWEEYQQGLQKPNCFETKDSTQIVQSELDKTEDEDPYAKEALNKIKAIRKHTQELEKEIEEFDGRKEDKVCVHLKELLIRNTIKLDNVETEGRIVVRKKRKEVLEYVHKCIDVLQNKIKG